MKSKRQIISIYLAICFMISISLLVIFINDGNTYHADTVEITDKRYCTATIDDYFSDNEIIVVMNDGADNVSIYDKNDFLEAEIEKTEELTQTLKDILLSGSAEDNNMFVKENFRSILKLTLTQHDKQRVLDTIKVLEKRTDILSAEPNYIMKSDEALGEPQYFSDNENFVGDNYWALHGSKGINLDEAYKITTGSSDVKVGIVDSGIDITHLELSGIVDGELSYDFISNNTENALCDFVGHGTHVAGIIGAKCDNGIGIDGICNDISLVSLAIDDSHNVFYSQLIRTISHAIYHKIPILNCSIGYNDYTSGYNNYAYYERDISYLEYMLLNYNGLFVNSAGNVNKCIDGSNDLFPETANADNFIVVGALNRNGKRWVKNDDSGSNYGNKVDIYAPGSDLISTHPIQLCNELPQTDEREAGHFGVNGYHTVQGTSFAAPFVAGVAALMLSVNPELTGAQLKKLITNNSDSITITLPDGGLQIVKKLNAGKAVKAAYVPIFDVEFSDDDTVEIVGSLSPVAHELTIPSTLYDLPVTSIGVNAFNGCDRLKKLKFASDSKLKTIGIQAFRGCANLESVEIPSTVAKIDIGAFMQCPNLRTVSIPQNGRLSLIEAAAFQSCTSLTEILLPSGLTRIAYMGFDGCRSLNKVVFNNRTSVTEIGNGCFNGTYNALKLQVPANLYDAYVLNAAGESYADKFVGF